MTRTGDGDEFALGSGITVHRVGFGAMQLAGPGVFGPPRDRAQAVRVLRRAVELGADHIDTSDFYGPWVVNELIAEALRPYGENLTLATKVGSYRDQQGSWLPLAHPDALKAQVHDNLRRLGTDSLGLVHLRYLGDQAGVTLADQLGALTELRDQGLVANIGLSNVSPHQFEQALALTRIASVQNLYNLVDRSSAALLDRTAELGVAFVPFFPLGSGFADSRARDDAALVRIAARHEITPAQVSLAWLLRRSPNVLLIPGTSTVGHLEENMAVARVELTEQDVSELDALTAEGDAPGVAG